jgi:N utilization substance protein A
MRANLNLADNEPNNKDESGSNSAGQSGDNQGISDVADADSESVEELVEEGNSFEAAAVEGVEHAKDPDVSEVTTRQVPEDDVPEEYRNAD